MTRIECLIVDDEPIARDIIRTYCGHLPYLNVAGTCGTALEARTVLMQQKIHILFLDINMPVMDGISFLKTLKTPPQVIFTTAYKEFAVDAFDLSACDYLLKPFSLERFVVAVDKAMGSLHSSAQMQEPEAAKEDGFFFLKADGKIYKIMHNDLLYAEANGNYTKVRTTQHTLMPAMTFSGFEELVPRSKFLRIHRSFIVNKSKIDHIEGNRVFIGSTEIPIGSNYREQFLKQIGLNG
ncbi:LytTR family DNA-binding domain-containing protein [Dyadobacter sp. 676]|uniref:LytTR family DNA-binding domain-containing protein n=1 Tax=Dyadobacter sp. 676 TaxID=3088362 RepID=A0AAU8FPU3_9BACT